jgi:hypothetical protein
MTDASASEVPSPADEPGSAPDPESPPAPLAAPDPGPEPAVPAPPVESTRRLLGASFDLLTRTPDDMRRASFYIGLVVLGTVGPFAVAGFAFGVVSVHRTDREVSQLLRSGFGAWYGLLGFLAGCGLAVAAVESRAMAAAILGGHLVRQPVTVREALARSRMVFWRVIVGSIILGVPVYIAQTALDAALASVLGAEADLSIVSSVVVAAVVGAPLTYLLTGIVLGDVDPFEAARRSFRVFRARKLAAALVAVFETVAVLLVVLGLGAGLDIALRVFDALGLGSDSGTAGLILITLGVAVGVFALGTLIYTAFAIAVAPQVVMFVGLTRATIGLDHVRPGGDREPSATPAGGRPFRWLTLPMRVAFIVAVIGLVAAVAMLTD